MRTLETQILPGHYRVLATSNTGPATSRLKTENDYGKPYICLLAVNFVHSDQYLLWSPNLPHRLVAQLSERFHNNIDDNFRMDILVPA